MFKAINGKCQVNVDIRLKNSQNIWRHLLIAKLTLDINEHMGVICSRAGVAQSRKLNLYEA